MTDPSRPLSCIPLRPRLRLYLYEQAAERAALWTKGADNARRAAEEAADPWWRNAYLESADFAQAHADRYGLEAVRWGGGY